MYRLQPIIAVFCVFLLIGPAFAGQAIEDPGKKGAPIQTEKTGFFSKLLNPYTPRTLAPIDLRNTNRLESLLRAGRLYLSLQDVIALALENNLDLEVQRYGPSIAEASIMRAKAGGFARGVSTSITGGPVSAAGGGVGQTGQSGVNLNASSQASNQTSTAVGNTVVTQTGTAIPNLDPSFTGALRWAHQTTPQTSSLITGTNALVSRADTTNFGLNQGFLTGTIASLGVSTVGSTTNNRSADFNPSKTGSLQLTVTQHLLQGWGVAVNNRQIRIAKNNREVADLTFKNQVITTVSSVMNLYWDLVAFNEDVRYKREALRQSEKLWSDNKKQVEIGTLAPIEAVRAEAEVASRQQDLVLSETQVLQQETILKNALSKNGVASPALGEARIVPLDRVQMPDVEPIAPIQDLVSTAVGSRPELAQARIQLTNQKISIEGSKSALKPQLDAVVSLGNNGLAGESSTLPVVLGRTRTNDPFFLGGIGSVFSQIFSRNFPDYSAGFNLTIPLRNRSAQADYINDQLTLRQQELIYQRQLNQVRVDVQNALIGLQQARARYQAAQKARYLQEQSLDAENKKLALGASTIYNVILIQRDLALAQSQETSALAAYAKARVELDRATGQTLTSQNISIDEAYKGQVKRPPSAIPDVAPQQ